MHSVQALVQDNIAVHKVKCRSAGKSCVHAQQGVLVASDFETHVVVVEERILPALLHDLRIVALF